MHIQKESISVAVIKTDLIVFRLVNDSRFRRSLMRIKKGEGLKGFSLTCFVFFFFSTGHLVGI